MRLSSFLRPTGLSIQLAAAGLLAVLLAIPANAEPADHAMTLDLDIDTTESPSALAGPQDDLSSQPQPVYPDGAPSVEAVESDDTDADTDAEAATEPSEPIVVVTIDKSAQEMTVWVDGVEKYTWPVSTGRPGYATPSGTYTASSMNKIWYSKQWDNAPMPNAIFFTKKGHAIHGTNEVRNLGKPASHGCVRLSPKHAATLYKLVEEKGLKRTEVVLTGATPGGDYKVTQPQRRYEPPRDRRGYYDRYGYYDEPPPVQQRPRRRRFFRPFYQAPPQQQYQPQRRGGQRWFRPPGY
jgi:lipoprotein-anchoring transpeptidase ErfK/SrfK